jgi:transposase InsO family protein
MDVSQVKQFLGPDLYMAAIFDAFARAPLAVQVCSAKPKASDMTRLFRKTLRLFGRPKFLITDQGGEFTGSTFTKTVGRLGVVHRLASADNIYATARLERFWRTLKESAGLYRIQLPLTVDDLEVRLEAVLTHYLCFRPHEGLKGATPAEAFLGMEPACLRAVEPPRGRPGMGPSEAPFVFEQLDGRFPILRPAA